MTLGLHVDPPSPAMDNNCDFEIILGTVSGSLIQLETNKIKDRRVHLRNEQKSEISALAWGRSNHEIVCGYKTGQAKIYNSVTSKLIDMPSPEQCPIVGVAAHKKSILFATQKGNIYHWRKGRTEAFINNAQTESTIEKMLQNPHNQHQFAIGGLNNDLKVYDIKTKQATFQAKSDRHDELELTQPVSVNGITFFNNGAGIDVGTITKQGQIRIYDTRAQRRPIKIFVNKDSVYTCVAATNYDAQVVVGSSKGYVQVMDLRHEIKPIKTFKSFMGGITDLMCAQESPILASCSLDRHFRIHNLDDMKIQHQEYVKIQLTQMLIRQKMYVAPTEEEEEVIKAVIEDDEELEDKFPEDGYLNHSNNGVITVKRKQLPHLNNIKKSKTMFI